MAMFRLSTELTLYVSQSGGRVSVYDQDGLAGTMNTTAAHELAKAIRRSINKAQQVQLKAQQAQELGK